MKTHFQKPNKSNSVKDCKNTILSGVSPQKQQYSARYKNRKRSFLKQLFGADLMGMSIERKHFSAHNFVWTKMRGDVTDAMFSDHVSKLTEETRDYSSFSELADCRELKNANGLTGAGIVDSALLEGERDPKVFGKLAILVSNREFFGYVSIYKLICEHYRKEVRIYKDLDEALGWLGLDTESDVRQELD